MVDQADFLFELGTEELPPKALPALSRSLREGFLNGLSQAGLSHGEVVSYAAPRRLALLVSDLQGKQPDRSEERRGPAVAVAYDEQGRPTKAAEGFARSCGVSVDQLGRLSTDKGEWLAYTVDKAGQSAAELLPDIAEQALNRLPIPKRMRWGDSEAQFVRPVHWLIMLHGDEVVPCTLLDTVSGRVSRGHRFMAGHDIGIDKPSNYAALLETDGRVIASFERRRELIREQVKATADDLGGVADMDEELLDEVTALNEWPMPIAGSFEERFLEVPHEALVLTMKQNQKYFPVFTPDGALMNHFITIANVDSPKPELIRSGNERVIRPRLADAMFFWEQDGKKRLEDHIAGLGHVVFQHKLGSMGEKSERVASLAAHIAASLGGDADLARRAGRLSRCDLMTAMVYEFPEMQGVMGRYQAARDGENPELAEALDEFYMPRFSGDVLPRSTTGTALALAERLDTLVGIFGIGMKPTGDKDPFALRRAALGALRILKEGGLDLPLRALLDQAACGLGDKISDTSGVVSEVEGFMLERLKGIYLEAGVAPGVFDAVTSVEPADLADFDRRIHAVIGFQSKDEAEALAAANKRIGNILRKSDDVIPNEPDESLFTEEAEATLHRVLTEVSSRVTPEMAKGDYAAALSEMAGLRGPVDSFFDSVMVMAEDPAVRKNRFALLAQVQGLFKQVADVGRI
ncbi:MAG: glycine--tRNA ligase subunit beta [Gammaproteobacteria bacterium]